jgi:glycosyltransferase involved in cell wall biosynthesis
MLPDRVAGDTPVVLYTGTKGPWGGLDLLLDAWEKIRHPTACLWVCGQGEHARLHALAEASDRIRDFGLVDEARLGELVERAAVLVNPRPPSFPSNRLNFPSKILEYLGTGKPIASTRTLSFGPGYDDVLLFAAEESPAALAAAIDRALDLSPAERQSHRARVERFAASHGDWPHVAERFLAWASAPADSRRSAHG